MPPTGRIPPRRPMRLWHKVRRSRIGYSATPLPIQSKIRFWEIAKGAPSRKVEQRACQNQVMGFGSPRWLGAEEQTRRIVVTPTPHARAISRHDLPLSRSSIALARSKITLGLPTGFPVRVPFIRTRSNPARTRSEIRRRSCFAIHAAIAIINSPAGPVVRK